MKRVFLLLFLAAAAFAADLHEERALAWVRAYNEGAAAFEEFAAAHYTPQALARRNKSAFEQLQKTHGKLRVASVRAGNGEITLIAEPERAGEPLRLQFRFAGDRIDGVGIELGGSGEDVQLPALQLPKSPTPEQLGAAVDAYVRKLADFSGAVLIARDGEVLFEQAYGRDNETSTRFDIGSITKDFTKVAIGQLAQAGKLNVNDPLSKYLSGYPNKDAASKITIQQLVDHTSGLGDIFTKRFFAADKSGFKTPSDFIAFFASDPLQFEPGQGRRYSNYGYVVLGAVIEKASGMSYFDYIEKHVPGTRFVRSKFSERGVPAGGSYSTARELFAFERALRGGKLLDPEWTRWFFGGMAGQRAAAGGAPGINAVIVSDDRWTVVVLGTVEPPLAEVLGEKVLFRALLQAF